MNKNENQNKDAAKKINPNAFIRQVAEAGSHTSVPVSEKENLQEDIPKENEVKENKKEKSNSSDYVEIFLTRNELRDRQSLYISRENFASLQALIRSISHERLSVSGLVDNIVKHHLELYEETINKIFDENIQRPIKKKRKK